MHGDYHWTVTVLIRNYSAPRQPGAPDPVEIHLRRCALEGDDQGVLARQGPVGHSADMYQDAFKLLELRRFMFRCASTALRSACNANICARIRPDDGIFFGVT
jgi:hypothetical protein